MTEIYQNNNIQINAHENAVSCLFLDDSAFNVTAYKVLMGVHEETRLIKCNKVIQNGKTKLVYNTVEYKPLSEVLLSKDKMEFLEVLEKLRAAIDSIEQTGYLYPENMLLDMEHIFWDERARELRLVCFPLAKGILTKDKRAVINWLTNNFESECSRTFSVTGEEIYAVLCNVPLLEKKMVPENADEYTPRHEFIKPAKIISKPKKSKKKIDFISLILFLQVCAGFTVAMFFLHPDFFESWNVSFAAYLTMILAINIVGCFLMYIFTHRKKSSSVVTGEIFLQSELNPSLCFMIKKEEFIFGRGKTDQPIDGVLADEASVSRVHCVIIFENRKYFIQDLGSANGTYVNGIRLKQDQKYPVQPDDRVSIAKVDFIVRSGGVQ